ncbi:hypothetical protein ACJRO7_031879, partial [Eucalyptus globulus]
MQYPRACKMENHFAFDRVLSFDTITATTDFGEHLSRMPKIRAQHLLNITFIKTRPVPNSLELVHLG